MSSTDSHYLRQELYDLARTDHRIFDFLQDGSLDGIWYWDLERQENRWMSPRFWRLFGYQPAERSHLATEWRAAIHPEDLPGVMKNFERHTADPSHPYDQVVRYLHKDGSIVWVRCRGLIIRDENGKPRRMLGAHTDVTSLKETEANLEKRNERISLEMSEKARLEAALRKLNDELEARVQERTAELLRAKSALEESNIELQQFAYIASHDLQAPLRGIAGFAQFLQDDYRGKLGEKADDYIDRIVGNTARMQQLINDLLAYSRVESRAAPFMPHDIGSLLGEVETILHSSIEDAGAEVTHDPLPTVSCDRSQMTQVLQNLIGNGIKYRAPDPPRIHVSAERNGSHWTFSVADNGIGIEPKHHERIFEIFRRLHTQQEYPGTGIGLAVCRRVVHRHGGRIWVESDRGKGSTFFFTIPARESADEDGLQ
jgi:PAS domain S-box-containing protein